MPLPPPKVVFRLDGLPKHHDKVTTYGGGGGKPIKMKSGPLMGWSVGGGKRSQVYGNTFHPSTPAPLTLPYGFIPMATSLHMYPLDPDLHLYYQSLPQNITRPGGELVEMMISMQDSAIDPPNNQTTWTPTAPFFFVSDNYTASQIYHILDADYGYVMKISNLIPFNSTGNIQPESIVQFYRGDTAAIVLQGYDNTRELSDNPNLMQNPPFPPDAMADLWVTINTTIGASIPLMHGRSSHTVAIGVTVGVLVFVALLSWFLYPHCRDFDLSPQVGDHTGSNDNRDDHEGDSDDGSHEDNDDNSDYWGYRNRLLVIGA